MTTTDTGNLLWFAGWFVALALIFLAGLRLPLQSAASGRGARFRSVGAIVAAAAVLFVANAALVSRDTHIDLTRERVFTPSQRALEVADQIDRDVQLTWFFQAGDQNGGRVKEIVQLMGKRNSRLKVRTVDPDKQPSLAESQGVRLYNAAVIEVDGRRLLVQSTDENEIAVGILKLLRKATVTICFVEGHKELGIVNPTRSEHFETGIGSNDRDAESMVTVTIPRGLLLAAKSLESLGYQTRRILPATGEGIPQPCSVVVSANPRSEHTPEEIASFERYLAHGGSVLLLYDLGFDLQPALAGLVEKLGVRLDPRAVLDPTSHYATDLEIVAVPTYENHVITRRLSLSFFPGVRPLELVPPAQGITTAPLFTSSQDSYLQAHADGVKTVAAGTRERRAHVLGAAAEGTWPGGDAAHPFRAVVVGDSDFASNKYLPSVANADLVLSIVRWLAREERAPAARSRIPVAPVVQLTKSQMQWIFLLVGVALPLGAALIGVRNWWRRR
ncbi:MAG: Gldg family protein [Betaproteobacteria bacterium]|nr:Gldg family protein [Betaproteobacteria bacterium]